MASPHPRRQDRLRVEPQAPATLERGRRIAPLADAVQRYLAATGLAQRRKDRRDAGRVPEAVRRDEARDRPWRAHASRGGFLRPFR